MRSGGLPAAEETAVAQRPVERDQRHVDDARGREIAEAGEVVLPVRIDQRERARQRLRRLVVIEHDHVEAEAPRLLERLMADGAAIDGDDELRALARRSAAIASALGP